MAKTVRRVADLGDLSDAERQVLDELDSGEVIRIGDGKLPEAGDEARRVRAALVRLLMLAEVPEHRPHEKGLRIVGAWLPDLLDLEGCRVPRDIGMLFCRLDASPMLRSASIDNLFVGGSVLPGLVADRLEARGNVHMRGTQATGEVRVVEAAIGGSLDYTGAKFRAEKGKAGSLGTALNADGLKAGGDVLLSDMEAFGEVRLVGAAVGGSLDCTGARFRTEKDGSGRPSSALCLDGATISRTFFLREGAKVEGILDLTGSGIGHINDAMSCWPAAGCLMLNRCRYGAFVNGPVDAESRLNWLSLQDPKRWRADFWPQPYEQCAKVLREMGHVDDARKVLIEKERRQRAARRKRLAWPWRWVIAGWDWLLGVTIGFGRQPLRAFLCLFWLWLVGAAFFWLGYRDGAMRPAEAVAWRGGRGACAPRRRGLAGWWDASWRRRRDGTIRRSSRWSIRRRRCYR